MNKKGLFGIPWNEMTSLVIFVIMLVAAIGFFSTWGPLIKKPGIDEEERNRADILVAQINALRTEDGEKEFATKIEGNFQIDVYGKCEEGQSTGCFAKPRICLINTENKKAGSYCRDVEGTNLESATGIRVADGLKMKKTEKDGEEITRVYS